tara:strand:- start:204 stop:1103 length:900 start_codon:yes stop_codon:yes gene_type:complete
MIEVIWDQSTAKAWQGYYELATYAAFQQHWAYGSLITAAGGTCHRAVIKYDGQVVALAQISVRRRIGFLRIGLCMRGPVWLAPLDETHKATIYEALRATCPISKPRLMLWMPEKDGGIASRHQVISPYHTVMWSLQPALETIQAAMDQKWRNRLTRAGDTMRVKELGARDYQWLLQEEADQSRRIGYSGISPQLIPYWQVETGKQGLLILAAELTGERVAGIICLIHGHSATYQIGWSSPEGKAHNAHNLLLWQAVKRLKARGIHQFDLGGINTEDAAGIARFKIGTGGQVVSLPGTYW